MVGLVFSFLGGGEVVRCDLVAKSTTQFLNTSSNIRYKNFVHENISGKKHR